MSVSGVVGGGDEMIGLVVRPCCLVGNAQGARSGGVASLSCVVSHASCGYAEAGALLHPGDYDLEGPMVMGVDS